MSDSTVFEEAASCLRLALEKNQLDKLQTSDFRVFIHETSSSRRVPSSAQQKVSEDLLAVLHSEQLSNNNQIVAATAYCKTIFHFLQEPEKTLKFFVNLLKSNKFKECTLFICHGIFQLNSWKVRSENGDILFEEIFSIVQNFCCNLTSTCYLAFKVLHCLLGKIHELCPNGTGISDENFKAVLDIVLSNWENPLTGVRQQNSLVLNQLLLFDKDYWNKALATANYHKTEIKASELIKHQCLLELTLTELSWTMKSKYFLLTSIVQDSNVPQILTEFGEDIIAGLTTSLSIPYLVSAGTDLYLALLASLSFKDWQHWFHQPFSTVISQQEPSLEVENIFNYWMNHTLTKFPSVFDDLVGETKDSLFSFVTFHKMGRKEGFTKWENLDTERIMDAVKHHSEKVRSQVVSLICTCSKASTPPSEEECGIVQRFLKENINSDNSALRQNLLKSITNFILRIRDFLLYAIKNKNDSSLNNGSDSLKNRCFVFLNWLRSFLLFNLSSDKCNYQRKTTTLEIYQIVLTCFGEEKKKNDPYKRKSNKNNLNIRNMDNFSYLFKFESDEDKEVLLNCLFDEDNNIRSSAASILMSHYLLNESNKVCFETMFKKGMALCTDQLFYKAESGALITQVLVTLAYKSPSQEFRNMINNGSDSFISVLLNSAEEQFSRLQDDLLKAASQGAFLYGTLQTLELITSNNSVPELSLNEDQLERLLSLIEKVTDYFITALALKSDPSSGYAPSFGEMGMAIAAVVESSSVKSLEITGEVDDTMSELQLTPAQQLVLSCVWLNLKDCTKLCSKLVSRHLSVRDNQRCVSVVVSVLRRCRHKGAIESAGLALYHITTHLTRSDEPELTKLPEELLEDFLQMLVATTAATVSRRSAGLAILVHRLITGDARPKKPLLHMCVSRLLKVAEDTNMTEQEALVDLPQSQALHFLRTLVQDSSLREHMAQYSLSISLVALTNLASPLWTIRNAALQLFGALVPKLVGQKPNQEQCKGNYYLAFEELHTHARPLVEMMLRELTSAASSGSTTSHSRLMPLLTLVTNLTLGLQTVLSDDMMRTILQFQRCFKMLFKSSIFNVRKLSSKAHALFVTSSKLVDMIDETAVEVVNYIEGRDCVIQSENELHGYVLNSTHLFGRFEDDKVGMKILLGKEKEVYTLFEKLGEKLLSSRCSYFTKALVFELKFPITYKGPLALPFNTKNHSLGYPHFVNKKLTCAILTLSDKEVGDIVNYCLLNNPHHDVQHSCLKALRLYARSKKNLTSDMCNALLSLLKDYLLFRKHNSVLVPLIFEVMLSLLEQMKDANSANSKPFCSPELLSYCLQALSSVETLLPVSTVVLPISSALLAAQSPIDMDAFLKISNTIKARSEPDCDQDIRLSAAKSIYFLSNILKTGELRENECGELIWKACVDLLQDEVTEVRYETSKCISVLIGERINSVLNPFISLECLFNKNLGKIFMSLERLVHCVRDKVPQQTDDIYHTTGISNPFDHGLKSIYAEEKVISQFAFLCLVNILLTEEDLDEQLKQSLCDLVDRGNYWHESDFFSGTSFFYSK